MTTTPGGDSDADAARGRRAAARFFWLWLIVATSMSVTGNVAHAVLNANAGRVALAAGAALVPPTVLLAATHSVSLLVRTRAGGFTYWSALAMTLALASCAFVLSFDALRSLAITLGLPTSIAWLWPCAIDVAIAQATLCLLSLSRRRPAAGSVDTAAARTSAARSDAAVARADTPRTVSSPAPRPLPLASAGERAAGDTPSDRRGVSAAPVALVAGSHNAEPVAVESVDTAAIQRWQPVAESLVREGVTSKHPELVATILAEREAGTPPSTIGRNYKVHHTTVGRILTAAQELTA